LQERREWDEEWGDKKKLAIEFWSPNDVANCGRITSTAMKAERETEEDNERARGVCGVTPTCDRIHGVSETNWELKDGEIGMR